MALRRPCASQRATKPALVGLLNNAMSVSHILGVMSCKWPNFTAATAFEIQPRAIFFARGAEVGRWVAGCGFSAGLKWVGGLRVSGFFGRPSGWVGRGFRVFCADINKGPCGPTAALRAPKSHQTRAGWSTK